MIRLHSFRALSAASAALLLALAPLAAFAQQEEPGPLNGANPGGPVPVPKVAPAPDNGATTSVSPINATIGPGDHLAIGVYGDQSLSQTAIVQSDGTIQYSLIGRVKLAGQTPVQAQETLTRAFSRYLKHPVVSVAIQQAGVMDVLVMGNVRQSGRYQVRSGAHITEAIAAAGGVAQFNGGFPVARVLEGDGTFKVADLQKLLRQGDNGQNIALSNNATVYVTGAETIRVQVLGAVTRPGNVEVFEGDRLDMALARAGAEAGAKPDLNHIFLTRKDPKTGKDVSYQLDLYKALKQGDTRSDPILQKDDRVYVPETRQPNGTAIGILGLLGRFFLGL
jgi:polysaccharide export outer membrane protein